MTVFEEEIIYLDWLATTAWKVSKHGLFFGPYLPVLWLNTEIYGVNLRIQPEYGKYGPERTRYLDTFHAVHMRNFLIERISQDPHKKLKWELWNSSYWLLVVNYCCKLSILDVCSSLTSVNYDQLVSPGSSW